MESIKRVYKIGPGPSSSHTIGPFNAAKDFLKHHQDFDEIVIDLYGSLALTGKGHGTDKILLKAFNFPNTKINFNYTFENINHPNTIDFTALKNKQIIDKVRYYSVGGGDILKDGEKIKKSADIYPFNSFNGLKNYLEKNKITSIIDVINNFEDKDIDEFLTNVFKAMINEIETNLSKEGYLPGNLGIKRVAKEIYEKAISEKDEFEKKILFITSYAYAASEGNASGELVVTAPTCGSCGVLPSVLYYEYKHNKVDISKIIGALKVAGILTNFVIKNASISGASLGCQAEIGTASAIASGALCYIHDLSFYQIEYASELALEHFLGLTCDPVNGYVQIPCIERNGIGALRSLISYIYAKDVSLLRKNKVSFDEVVKAMKITGESLSKDYKETSIGGLAKIIHK